MRLSALVMCFSFIIFLDVVTMYMHLSYASPSIFDGIIHSIFDDSINHQYAITPYCYYYYEQRSVDYGESPRKMSRVGSADVTVDKLFSSEENQHAAKDGFQFRKFGMEINQRTSPENNQNR